MYECIQEEVYNTQEQNCDMIQETQLETVTGSLCQVECRNKFYDKPTKEYNSVQKYMKKIIQKKECDTVTDHPCEFENVRTFRQVPEQGCNTVFEDVDFIESVKKCLTKICQEFSTGKVKKCNLVYNPFSHGICCTRVHSRKYNDVSKEKVRMNLDRMGQEMSVMKFSESILNKSLYKDATYEVVWLIKM